MRKNIANKMVVIMPLLALLITVVMLASCEPRDLETYDNITYEYVTYETEEPYYAVDSIPTDVIDIAIPRRVNGIPVKAINPGAFRNCSSLKNISLPDSIYRIGDDAFENCTSLTKLNLPCGVQHITGRAVLGCVNLTEIAVDENSKFYKSVEGNVYSKDGTVFTIYAPGKKGTSYEILSGVTVIGESAFYGNKTINQIVIPEGVTEIGYRAFESCTYLETVIVPESLQKIQSMAFWRCTALKNIDLSKGVTFIYSNVFRDCISLEKVEFSENLNEISFLAFSGCTKLKSIYLPSQIETIYFDAFKNCNNLTIYCEASSKPQGWDETWYGDATVVWGASVPTE